MDRRRVLLRLALLAILLLPTLAPRLSVAQASPITEDIPPLASALPDQPQPATPMTIEAEGARTVDEIAAGFPDPADAAAQLARWGFVENAYRDFTGGGAPDDRLEVSLHRFASHDDALAALEYYAAARAEALNLAVLPDAVASGTRALGGDTPAGQEVTYYDVAGDVLARVTAISPSSPPRASELVGIANGAAREAAGTSTYTSPQFGYRIEWANDIWLTADWQSVPGEVEKLLLNNDHSSLTYAWQPATLPPVADPGWEAAMRAVTSNVLTGMMAEVGAQWGGMGLFGGDFDYQRAGEDRTRWFEVHPLPGSLGVVVLAFDYPADRAGWAGPRPTGIIAYEDWAGTLDDDIPPPPPGDLATLAGAAVSRADVEASLTLLQGDDHSRTELIITGSMRWPVSGSTAEYFVDVPGVDGDPARALVSVGGVDGRGAAQTVRDILNCCLNLRFSTADVVPTAEVPYLISHDGADIVWSLADSDWIMTIEAETSDDALAVLNAIAAELTLP